MSFGTIQARDTEGIPHEIQLDAETVKAILTIIRTQGKADSRFDINLAEGKVAESELHKLIENGTIELKRDFKASETGNVCVEYMSRSKPSGISVSLADWWAFMLSGDKYNDE